MKAFGWTIGIVGALFLSLAIIMFQAPEMKQVIVSAMPTTDYAFFPETAMRNTTYYIANILVAGFSFSFIAGGWVLVKD